MSCRARAGVLPGAMALLAGLAFFLTPLAGLAAIPPDASGSSGSVSLKVSKRPAAQAEVQPEQVSSGTGSVSLKISRRPAASQDGAVSVKVQKPPAAPRAAGEGGGTATVKIASGPPAKTPAQAQEAAPAPEAPPAAPQPGPAPGEGEVQPLPAPSEQMEGSAPPVPPVIRIGAEDVGEAPAVEEEDQEVNLAEEKYRYVSGAKPNPFRPLTARMDASEETQPREAVVEESAAPGPVVQRPVRVKRTPIEKYPLNALDLVAIMRMKREALALVQIPDGNKGFVIRNGTYIGSEGGRVAEIDLRQNRVIVELEEVDMFGNVTVNRRQLSLQKSAGDF